MITAGISCLLTAARDEIYGQRTIISFLFDLSESLQVFLLKNNEGTSIVKRTAAVWLFSLTRSASYYTLGVSPFQKYIRVAA